VSYLIERPVGVSLCLCVSSRVSYLIERAMVCVLSIFACLVAEYCFSPGTWAVTGLSGSKT
jgi:hypothetical protein